MKLHFFRQSIVVATSAVALGVSAAPPTDSPYFTDVQSSHSEDPVQEVFSDVSEISCMISLMRPENHVGESYVAIIDQNKCKKKQTKSSSNGAATEQPSLVTARLTPTLKSNGAIDLIGTLIIPPNTSDNTPSIKNIQIHANIEGGSKKYPPYGRWQMNFCSSVAPASGTCSDGKGYLQVTEQGVSIWEGGGNGSQSGQANYLGDNAGYGVISQINNNNSANSKNGSFKYSNGLYHYKQTTPNIVESCYDPRISEASQFNIWQNYLYDQVTGQKVKYDNPAFFIKTPGTSRTIGEASYWGVNFWSNDTAAEKNSTSVEGPDGTVYQVRSSPGTLRKSTTAITNLSAIDGVTLNYSFGGWVNNNNNNPAHWIDTTDFVKDNCSESTCSALTRNTSGTGSNIALIGHWSDSNTSFVFTGFLDWTNNGAIYNFANPVVVSLTAMQGAHYTWLNSWVNGSNSNYYGPLTYWNNGSQQNYSASNLPLNSQTQVTVSPADPSLINAAFYCVGNNCPQLANGTLTNDAQNIPYPYQSNDVVALTWGSTQNVPMLGNVPLDWSNSSINPNQQGHFYQLYTSTTDMTCNGNKICPEKVTNPQSGSTTYYSWQTGGQWDKYVYLTDSAGHVPVINPPMNLSYTVSSAPGNSRAYIGKTITVQSPEPGNIWLPGHCVDTLGNTAECNSDTKWVNEVIIPFAQDATGEVTLINSNGQATSTKYYAKWLSRGVFYKQRPLNDCLGLDLSAASGLTAPTASGWDSSVANIPWPDSSAFAENPKVKDGMDSK
jgi:hypothetical protein